MVDRTVEPVGRFVELDDAARRTDLQHALGAGTRRHAGEREERRRRDETAARIQRVRDGLNRVGQRPPAQVAVAPRRLEQSVPDARPLRGGSDEERTEEPVTASQPGRDVADPSPSPGGDEAPLRIGAEQVAVLGGERTLRRHRRREPVWLVDRTDRGEEQLLQLRQILGGRGAELHGRRA